MSTIRANNILDSSGGNTAKINGYTPTLSNMAGRNRIINGDMRIDQRNNGASVATSSNGVYFVDRWRTSQNQNSKYTAQQNAGAVTPPSGFTNYLGITSSSAYSVLAGDYIAFGQRIEGFNAADLGWGTASAQSITLSFWVRSSLTGTFGGAIANAGSNRSYPFTYTISAANTWEQKSITISGDTSGTWDKTNGVGIALYFNLGTGATFSGTAGTWAGADYVNATGSVNLVDTNGATFYITGVQLEAGTNATPFEQRDYGRELIMCQRYYIGDGQAFLSQGAFDSAYNTEGMFINLPTTMRANPTVVAYGWNKEGHISGSNTSNPANQSVTATTTSFILRWNNSSSGYRAYGYAGSITPYLSAEL